MNLLRFAAALVAAGLIAAAPPIAAQNPAPVAPQAAPAISQDLLDSLLAPIALYPDELLSQVLMAATYPLEVVEAARFVRANPNLSGIALDNALKDKTWDASVLSLAAFPQILDMMNDKLDWTQRLGDAFLDDEAGVMRTVQMLRVRAQQAGNLQSTDQQRVIVQDRTILIEPAQPQYVFIPVYNPTIIFGPWWAPAYVPWYWYPPPIWGYPPAPPNWGYYPGFFWGRGWGITYNNWGWCRPNWGGNNIHINVNNTNNVWVNRPAYRERLQNNGNWSHSVEHRRGVAYRDTATGNKYRPTSSAGVQTREGYRGRNVAQPPPGTASNFTRPSPGTAGRPSTGGVTDKSTRPAPGTFDRPAPGGAGGGTARPSPGTFDRPAPGGANSNLARPAPDTYGRPAQGASGNNAARPLPSVDRQQPAYRLESRPQVQRDASRGAQSRATMQSQPQAPQTQQRSAPQTQQRSAPNMERGGAGGSGRGGGGGEAGGGGQQGRGR
jgi:hypothetical protein